MWAGRRSFSACLILERHDYGPARSAEVRQEGFDFDRAAVRKLYRRERSRAFEGPHLRSSAL